MSSQSKRHASASAHPDSPPRSFADPSRPDLFYHLLDSHSPDSSTAALRTPLPLPAFALSFLEHAPRTPTSASVVGWLPAVSGAEGDAGLNDFKENPLFRDVMHRAIREGLEQDVDDIQRNAALQLQSGWMHIHDERNIPAMGRVGDPDDIIASVLVEEGKILPDTYQPMPAYRIATADGVLQLTEGLAQKLREVLEAAERG